MHTIYSLSTRRCCDVVLTSRRNNVVCPVGGFTEADFVIEMIGDFFIPFALFYNNFFQSFEKFIYQPHVHSIRSGGYWRRNAGCWLRGVWAQVLGESVQLVRWGGSSYIW